MGAINDGILKKFINGYVCDTLTIKEISKREKQCRCIGAISTIIEHHSHKNNNK